MINYIGTKQTIVFDSVSRSFVPMINNMGTKFVNLSLNFNDCFVPIINNMGTKRKKIFEFGVRVTRYPTGETVMQLIPSFEYRHIM